MQKVDAQVLALVLHGGDDAGELLGAARDATVPAVAERGGEALGIARPDEQKALVLVLVHVHQELAADAPGAAGIVEDGVLLHRESVFARVEVGWSVGAADGCTDDLSPPRQGHDAQGRAPRDVADERLAVQVGQIVVDAMTAGSLRRVTLDGVGHKVS